MNTDYILALWVSIIEDLILWACGVVEFCWYYKLSVTYLVLYFDGKNALIIYEFFIAYKYV